MKHFTLPKIQNMIIKYGYERGLASMIYNFFDKKTAGIGIKSMLQNEQLAEEIHEQTIRKLKKNVFNSWYF